MCCRTWIRSFLTTSIGLATAWAVHAAPIPLDLSISGFASFDATFSNDPLGDAVQSGTLTRIAGGTTTSTTLTGGVASGVTGANPLDGSLSATGDGFGVSLSGSGSYNSDGGGAAEIGPTYADLGMTLLNNSGTVTYTIILRYHYEATANADVELNGDANGSFHDAYGSADVRLVSAPPPSTDVGGTALVSDLLFGDSIDGDPPTPSSFGDPLSTSTTILLTVTLAPGAQVDFGDSGAELMIAGGAFDAGTAFSTSGALMLTVYEIRSSEPPTPTPAPGTLILLAPALLGLAWSRKRPVGFASATRSTR